MPYYIKHTIIGRHQTYFAYEPDFPIEHSRPFTQGKELTEQDYKNFPSAIRLEKKPSAKLGLADITGRNIGPFIVSERVKNKIEELDPGLNEYLPLAVLAPDGMEMLATYYFIVLRHKADALNYDMTYFKRDFGYEAAVKSKFSFSIGFDAKKYPITVRRSLIEGRHFWRGTEKTDLYSYFCSDELGDFILGNKIRGWELFKIHVSDD